MATKMLIDAAHPEETRVVVVREGKVEDFDFEAASRKQLRGNIYLAKVTRVEPSLQAAFVDYGGNRHGFLAFSEIHPDYYQIPYADRQALIAQEAAEDNAFSSEAEGNGQDNGSSETASEAAESAANGGSGETEPGSTVEEVPANGDDTVESVGGGDDALEEVPERRPRPRRSYKIQEVIKKRQVLLVQVVKEERGNKGAALTTYLSLAGRYSVLMPNTARGGGISRKITNAADRKRLKAIAGDLDVPEGMGVILRTAGASRTKAEVKRDFEYLLRLWENVRELTLKSVAPTLVYEEGSLVKRAIRDLYTKDIDQVLVNGDAAYREAKDFMRMLMPSHAKNIQPYRDREPIFFKHNVERQLDAMFSPQVTLKSGGYIVLNQTEALVAIDVNSGRSTREHNIEDTALKTNLEAADEVARQLRLRDLAGLIVIDFIDMEEKRNNRAVERRLKDALKNDRARIQVGRISHFGLMEMSRQRIRFGVLESSLETCPHCEGTGHIRSVESVALHVLRSMENELLRSEPADLIVTVRTPVALYMLNQKRDHLAALEARGITVTILADETLSGTAFKLEKGEPARAPTGDAVIRPVSVDPDEPIPVEDEDEDGDEEEERFDGQSRDEERGGRKGRRRRRRRRGGEGQPEQAEAAAEAGDEETSGSAEAMQDRAEGEGENGSSRRRRRGRRGGRRHRREAGDQLSVQARQDAMEEPGEAAVEEAPEVTTQAGWVSEAEDTPSAAEFQPAAEPAPQDAPEQVAEAPGSEEAAEEAEKPKRKARAPRRAAAKRKPKEEVTETAPTPESEPAAEAAPEPEPAPEPVPEPQPEPAHAGAGEEEREPAPADADGGGEGQQDSKPRRGWWQRKKLFGF